MNRDLKHAMLISLFFVILLAIIMRDYLSQSICWLAYFFVFFTIFFWAVIFVTRIFTKIGREVWDWAYEDERR